VNKKADTVRVYLPPDANTLLRTVDHCLGTYDRINVVVAARARKSLSRRAAAPSRRRRSASRGSSNFARSARKTRRSFNMAFRKRSACRSADVIRCAATGGPAVEISLIVSGNSLFSAQKFPALLSREFGSKPLKTLG
jgi:hypothetical protein